MLTSKIDQLRTIAYETGSEANIGFGRTLMPSKLGMRPPKSEGSIFKFSDTAKSWKCDMKVK